MKSTSSKELARKSPPRYDGRAKEAGVVEW